MSVYAYLLCGILMSNFTRVSGRSLKWRRVPSMDGKIVSGPFITFSGLEYKTFCAQMCSQYINCYSFFFDSVSFSCALHDKVYTSASTISAFSRYYISAEREMTTTTISTTMPTSTTFTTTTIPTTTTSEPTTTTTTVPTPICPSNYINNGGYCFKISSIKKSWNDARTRCQNSPGGDLLVIDNLTKQNYFNSYFKNNNHLNSYHFGVHHIYSNGNFVLVDGRTQATTSFTNWGSGEPNNLNGPDLCGYVEWHSSSNQLKWNDGGCSYLDYYICEVK